MNRYPWWKYALIVIALAFAALYTVPNFFGQSPAVQISSGKSTIKIEATLIDRVRQTLVSANAPAESIYFDSTATGGTVRARFANTDLQLKAKDALRQALNPGNDDGDYVIALNLVPNTPRWMQAVHALPMALGLDLRGGVHFLMQIDMRQAIIKRIEAVRLDLRTQLRDKNIRYAGITQVGESVELGFRDQAAINAARDYIRDNFADLQIEQRGDGADGKLVITLSPKALKQAQEDAIKQNISTLNNRVNQLGTSEPVVQQQGVDRIVVQLPGEQDVARAKQILGRTATLQVRLVDQDAMRAGTMGVGNEVVPERHRDGSVTNVPLKREVITTGDRLTKATATFDSQQQRPIVSVGLDAEGGRAMGNATRENVGKLMAMVLYERGKGEAVSVATIQSEFSNNFQISGAFTTQEAADLALLLRSGSLAAPMEIIEERTIGPSLGADNIAKGFHSVLWGFVLILIFMTAYYAVFGLISVAALATNVLMLIALLSLLQTTLTLPGIAAIALALGMAIDSNVLINERIREELRNGKLPQQAIHEGYDRAWATILDSNVTTLIAGVALLIFGSGPVRGFAVVHCLGILTSMFSAILVSRALVNLVYGRKKRLQKVHIGTVWQPGLATK